MKNSARELMNELDMTVIYLFYSNLQQVIGK